MRVRDVMPTDVKSCRPEDNLALIASMMWETDCGIVPAVGSDGEPIGVVTDRDICIAVATKQRLASEIAASEIISPNIFSCSGDDQIRAVLGQMKQNKVRRLLVLDEDGKLGGIISLSDIILHCEPGKGKELPGFSYEDVISTLQSICKHRVQGPSGPESQRTAVA